ncbi:hypothetical protein BD413DRAFT_488104 [Trametes elegans]|nr:hypothetical protein BD413DRAFT_488104 [Trametes elegans]
MAGKTTYCAEPSTLAQAISTLSTLPAILLDCEARDLGMPGGALSLLSLSDIAASHVFLIDVLAFPSPSPSPADSDTPSVPHPALLPLLALLTTPTPLKVVWDGRADALELLLTYALPFPASCSSSPPRPLVLTPVLDLQLIEVTARARDIRPNARARRLDELTKGAFAPIASTVRADPAAFDGVWKLRGLGQIVRLLRLGDGSLDQKDPEVVAMHQRSDSSLWMARPLPAYLQRYAAHDLALIALLHAHFLGKDWVCAQLPALCTQSERYVGMFRTREEHARYAALGLKAFMPLEFLELADAEGLTYACARCERELSTSCFVLKRTARGQQRLSYCRLCEPIAHKNGETRGVWVGL